MIKTSIWIECWVEQKGKELNQVEMHIYRKCKLKKNNTHELS
jgi:hypothetical protein